MKKTMIASLLALPLCASVAQAQETAVKISGFGTAAATYADDDRAEFARPNQASGSPSTGSRAASTGSSPEAAS